MRKRPRQISAQLYKLFYLFSFLFFSFAAYSQNVTGTVTDADNKPVSNATVQVNGTSRVSLTDDAGRFSIAASGSNVLVITSVGYIKQEVTLDGKQSLSITLSADT